MSDPLIPLELVGTQTRLTGATYWSVWRLTKSGALRSVRVGRKVFTTATWVDEYIERNSQGGGRAA
jgi:hypothetical protein